MDTAFILRNLKLGGSLFHLMTEIKQSVAYASGKGGILNPRNIGEALKQLKTALKPVQKEWWASRMGQKAILAGIHKGYSLEYKAAKAFRELIENNSSKFAKVLGVAGKAVKPIQLYNSWLFETFIPEMKRLKFTQEVSKLEQKLGRETTPAEDIEIAKDIQNFFGEMDERLFGRSGAITSVLRLFFLAPGFREGNFRTIGKALLQGKYGKRSRGNILWYSLLYAMIGTAGTLLMTGHLPDFFEKPEEDPEKLAAQFRDIFRIRTNYKDNKGRDILIDTGSTDKDYVQQLLVPLFLSAIGKPKAGITKASDNFWKTVRGMESPVSKSLIDAYDFARGKVVYDWKGDKVYDVYDPTLKKLFKVLAYEGESLLPIPVSIAMREHRRGTAELQAIGLAASGARTVAPQIDTETNKLISQLFHAREKRQDVYIELAKSEHPRKAIAEYNKLLEEIEKSGFVTKALKKDVRRLKIDEDKLLGNKILRLTSDSISSEEIKKIRQYLKNFKIDRKKAARLLAKLTRQIILRNGRPVRRLSIDSYIDKVEKLRWRF